MTGSAPKVALYTNYLPPQHPVGILTGTDALPVRLTVHENLTGTGAFGLDALTAFCMNTSGQRGNSELSVVRIRMLTVT